MARYGTLKRNVNRNIKHWKEEGEERVRDHRIPMSKLLAVVIAIALSSALIPLTMNIVFRVPDLYKFDLGRTGSVTDEELGIKDVRSSIAAITSQFMCHESNKFQLSAQVDDNTVTVFSVHDGAVMQKLRSFLDDTLVIGITSGIAFLALSLMLIKWGRLRELLRGFTAGTILFFAEVALIALCAIFKGPAMAVWEDIVGAKFVEGDKIPQFFFDGFLLSGLIAMTVLSILILLVLFSFFRLIVRGKFL